jgi:hypothetical protein
MSVQDKMALADLILKLVGVTGAAIAFIVGYIQYKKGQNWQKAQVLLSLIDSFEEDKCIECACQMLDWDEREVRLADQKPIKFKNEMLLSALRVPVMDTAGDNPTGDGFTETESLIRDCFDAFFDFLHKLYAFRRNGLLTFQDLAYFNYWFELIHNIEEYKAIPGLKQRIFSFMRCYKFVGAEQLIEEYARKPDPLLLAGQLNEACDKVLNAPQSPS